MIILSLLKCYYDENHAFSIEAILRHKVASMRRKMLFTIFKYLLLFQRYSSFKNMQISLAMTSYTQLNQNFACRIVLGLKKYDHITDGLKSLNWLNVNDRLLVNDLLMVHKCIHNLIPSYLTGKFTQRLKIHGRNTRGSGELDLPFCRLKTGQRSFAFRGAKLYNNLPNKIKQTSDVKKFKAKVCNYLLNLKLLVFSILGYIHVISC